MYKPHYLKNVEKHKLPSLLIIDQVSSDRDWDEIRVQVRCISNLAY